MATIDELLAKSDELIELLEKAFTPTMRPPKMGAVEIPTEAATRSMAPKKIKQNPDGTQTIQYEAAKPKVDTDNVPKERVLDYSKINPKKTPEQKKREEEEAPTLHYGKVFKRSEEEKQSLVKGEGMSILSKMDEIIENCEIMLLKVEHPDLDSMSSSDIHTHARELAVHADPNAQAKNRMKAIIYHEKTPVSALKELSEHHHEDIAGAAKRQLTKRPQREELKAKEAGTSPEKKHDRAKVAHQVGRALGMSKSEEDINALTGEELAKSINPHYVTALLEKADETGVIPHNAYLLWRNFGELNEQTSALVKGIIGGELCKAIKRSKSALSPAEQEKLAPAFRSVSDSMSPDLKAKVAQVKADRKPKAEKCDKCDDSETAKTDPREASEAKAHFKDAIVDTIKDLPEKAKPVMSPAESDRYKQVMAERAAAGKKPKVKKA